MSEGSGEIIIKGGSTEIEFDPTLFKKDDSDPKKHKHSNDELVITEIFIESGGNKQPINVPAEGFKGQITVRFKKRVRAK